LLSHIAKHARDGQSVRAQIDRNLAQHIHAGLRAHEELEHSLFAFGNASPKAELLVG
jgi:hypothetical protein